MKARVELVIRDEEGNILSQLDPYWMELGNQSLHDIEGAVENWRQEVLPDIEADLLRQAQSQFTQQVKKTLSQSAMVLLLFTLRLYMASFSFSCRNIKCKVKGEATSILVTK